MDEGWTALHIAAAFGDKDSTKDLISLGADVNAIDADGWSPLMLIVGNIQDPPLHKKEAKIEVSQILLTEGANPEYKNDIDVSAITLARESNDDELIELLVGGKKRKADEKGNFFLGNMNDPPRKVKRAKIESSQMGLAEGAESDHKNVSGVSAIQMAKGYQHDQLFASLKVTRGIQANVKKDSMPSSSSR